MGNTHPLKYSWNEIQKHNTKDSCWIVIDRQVYDVTPYLDLHPGGSRIILQNSGQDCTQLFKVIHTQSYITQILHKYQI